MLTFATKVRRLSSHLLKTLGYHAFLIISRLSFLLPVGFECDEQARASILNNVGITAPSTNVYGVPKVTGSTAHLASSGRLTTTAPADSMYE